MSFAEKVHNRLLALEKQVVALNERLKALEKPLELPVVSLPMELTGLKAIAAQVNTPKPPEPSEIIPLKRKPGRPKKVVNG